MNTSPETVKFYNQLSLLKESPSKNQRVVRYFSEVHLGNGHRGLSRLAKKSGINVHSLTNGEYVIFTNKSQTALKMFAPGNVIAHLKMPGSSKLNPNVIAMIPLFFNGVEIKYDEALKKVLRRQFPKSEV